MYKESVNFAMDKFNLTLKMEFNIILVPFILFHRIVVQQEFLSE